MLQDLFSQENLKVFQEYGFAPYNLTELGAVPYNTENAPEVPSFVVESLNDNNKDSRNPILYILWNDNRRVWIAIHMDGAYSTQAYDEEFSSKGKNDFIQCVEFLAHEFSNERDAKKFFQTTEQKEAEQKEAEEVKKRAETLAAYEKLALVADAADALAKAASANDVQPEDIIDLVLAYSKRKLNKLGKYTEL